jgi:hypothetical protein
MAAVPSLSERLSGTACLAGGLLSVAASVAVGIATASTSVSDDLFRYPWTTGPFVAFCLCAAALHLLILTGVVALVRSGVAGDGRAARVGGPFAIAGMVLLFAGEFASLSVIDRAESSDAAGLVGGLFGLATVVGTIGLLGLGAGTLRAGRWEDWRRVVPLACGICLLLAIPIQFTSFLWAGLIPYGCAFAALGLALAGSPARAVAPARA